MEISRLSTVRKSPTSSRTRVAAAPYFVDPLLDRFIHWTVISTHIEHSLRERTLICEEVVDNRIQCSFLPFVFGCERSGSILQPIDRQTAADAKIDSAYLYHLLL